MISEPTELRDKNLPPFSMGFVQVLDVRDRGLTIAECFDEGRFLAKDMWLEGLAYQIWRIKALDGSCWAEVIGRTDNGRIVMVPDLVPVPGSKGVAVITETAMDPNRRKVGRPPKAAAEAAATPAE